MPAPYPTYHVGDRVIVRTWDDMMEEFGSNPYGDITVHPNKLSFILDMKPYCGKEFIVVKIVHDKDLPDEPIYFLDYLSCTHAGFNVDDSPPAAAIASNPIRIWLMSSSPTPPPSTTPILNPDQKTIKVV